MPRPHKNNAEYFSHDAAMRNDLRVKALRNRYGLNGYAVYNLLLEVLADADNFRVPWNPLQRELLSGDFGIESSLLEEIVDYMTSVLGLFAREDEFLFCPALLKRMQPLLDQRERWRKNKSLRDNITPQPVSQQENQGAKSFSPEKTPQSKGKKRKEDKGAADGKTLLPEPDDFIATLFIRCFSRLPNLGDRMITEGLISRYGRDPTQEAFLKARGNLGEKISLAYIRGILSGEANGTNGNGQRTASANPGVGSAPGEAGKKSRLPADELTGRWEQYIRENPPPD